MARHVPTLDSIMLWLPREIPLSPLAVVATGDAAQNLARRLLKFDDSQLQKWRGVSWDVGIALEGDDLPWADGALYLGRDADAPLLLLPAHLRPDAPLGLFQRAFLRGLKRELAPPIALWPSEKTAIALANGLPLSRAKLEYWAGLQNQP